MRTFSRTLIAAILAIAIVMAVALPAFASGSVSCGSGGYVYTRAYGTSGWNYHKVNGVTHGHLSSGTYTEGWGYYTGSPGWDVWGAITGETAWCAT